MTSPSTFVPITNYFVALGLIASPLLIDAFFHQYCAPAVNIKDSVASKGTGVPAAFVSSAFQIIAIMSFVNVLVATICLLLPSMLVLVLPGWRIDLLLAVAISLGTLLASLSLLVARSVYTFEAKEADVSFSALRSFVAVTSALILAATASYNSSLALLISILCVPIFACPSPTAAWRLLKVALLVLISPWTMLTLGGLALQDSPNLLRLFHDWFFPSMQLFSDQFLLFVFIFYLPMYLLHLQILVIEHVSATSPRDK